MDNSQDIATIGSLIVSLIVNIIQAIKARRASKR